MRGAKYDLVGAAARAALINDHAWVITDGGPVTGASMNPARSIRCDRAVSAEREAKIQLEKENTKEAKGCC